MKSGPVTLKDIANQLGVSMGTVSRALKDYPGISDKTKEAVRALAKELKYRPNPVAQNLKSQRSKIIGVVCPKIFHTFFSAAINGIMEVADESGYSVILVQTNESFEKELKETSVLLESPLEGLLVSSTFETSNYDHIQRFQDYGIPVVQFDRITDDLESSRILVDDYEGAFTATQHLIEQGCRRIALVRGQLIPLIQQRVQGFLDALKDQGVPFREDLVFENTTSDIEEGIVLAREITSLKERPDAIFAFADVTALGLIMGLKKEGVKIPEDIAVVGFNDSTMSTLVEPSLTAIAQPAFQMGRKAAETLLHEIEVLKNDDEPIHSQTILKTELIVRASSLKRP
ncbi:MAG: LacI family DNA-binding transcriptional regulator [Bacteroidota bacterium]